MLGDQDHSTGTTFRGHRNGLHGQGHLYILGGTLASRPRPEPGQDSAGVWFRHCPDFALPSPSNVLACPIYNAPLAYSQAQVGSANTLGSFTMPDGERGEQPDGPGHGALRRPSTAPAGRRPPGARTPQAVQHEALRQGRHPPGALGAATTRPALSHPEADQDSGLIDLLRVGVPTGALSPLTPSGQWPLVAEVVPNEELDLVLCEGNWKHAEEHPEIVQGLIDKEVEAGFVVRTDLTEASAKLRWPAGIAVGRLNVVLAEGKDPRLVVDSSICNVNLRCTLPEKVALPMASDVKIAHLPDDPVTAFAGASFDFKAAHKQIQVRPEEHGLLLFAHQGVVYHYRVCHFGGRFSAYWWQRFSALLLRQIHSLLGGSPHRAWLYVDDLLAQLHRPTARDQLLILVIYFQAILAPMSWKKAQFGDYISWCGWDFDFAVDVSFHTCVIGLYSLTSIRGLSELLTASSLRRFPDQGWVGGSSQFDVREMGVVL